MSISGDRDGDGRVPSPVNRRGGKRCPSASLLLNYVCNTELLSSLATCSTQKAIPLLPTCPGLCPAGHLPWPCSCWPPSSVSIFMSVSQAVTSVWGGFWLLPGVTFSPTKESPFLKLQELGGSGGGSKDTMDECDPKGLSIWKRRPTRQHGEATHTARVEAEPSL